MAILKTFWEALGKSPQARVKSFLLILAAVTVMIILTLNLRLGYNNPTDVQRTCKCAGFWIEWGPAADITVNIKKTSSSGGTQ